MMTTYDIDKVTYEKAFSKEEGIPMIKMCFWDGHILRHSHYICLEHQGKQRVKAVEFIDDLFNDQYFFNDIEKKYQTVDHILLLLCNAPEFFRKITEITLDGKELIGIKFAVVVDELNKLIEKYSQSKFYKIEAANFVKRMMDLHVDMDTINDCLKESMDLWPNFIIYYEKLANEKI